MPDYALQITPEEAGWAFCGLRVLAGEAAFDTGDDELIVLPLEGGAEVTVDGESFTLRGPRPHLGRPDRLRLRAA